MEEEEEEEQRPLKRESALCLSLPLPMSTTKEAMTENPSLLSDGSAISHKDYIFGDGKKKRGKPRHSLEPQRNFSPMSGLDIIQG